MSESLAYITTTATYASYGARGITTGLGAQELEVVGHDPCACRVFMLEHIRGGAKRFEPAQLLFVRTAGVEAGRTIAVRSWYRGDLVQVAAEFPHRLERLRARLSPLPELDLDELSLSTRVLDRSAVRLYPDESPIRKFRLRITVRPSRTEPVTPIGGIVTVTAYLRPKAVIESAYQLPGGDALAIVSYVGVPFEIGLPRHVAVLVPM